MCNNVVDTYPSITGYVPDQFKAQEICHDFVSDYPFKLNIVIIDKRLKRFVIKPLMTFYQH